MKKKTLMIATLLSCFLVFAGCGNDQKTSEAESIQEDQENQDDFEEFEDMEDVGDCYITFEDGDIYMVPVDKYGDEFTFPESYDKEAAGEFYGWLGMGCIYQPGDKAEAEEFMTYTALRSDPEAGTVVMLDEGQREYMMMSSSEAMDLGSPYDNYQGNSDGDSFFDHWGDDAGKTYEIGESVKVENGDVLILSAVYSTDHSAAYKVDVYYNTGDPDFDEEYHCYIKKGASMPLVLMIEPAGCQFDGWYDAPEGGNKLAGAEELFTPTADISIYGHWNKG